MHGAITKEKEEKCYEDGCNHYLTLHHSVTILITPSENLQDPKDLHEDEDLNKIRKDPSRIFPRSCKDPQGPLRVLEDPKKIIIYYCEDLQES